jgi:glycosyltransferase involved in cell wall biosynthesis
MLKKLSIIVPFYNEEGNILNLCHEISKSISKDFGSWAHEIILVNDGSSDHTRDEILEAKKIYPNIIAIHLQRNYWQSIWLDAGLRAASGDIVVTLDGDWQNDPQDIIKLYDKLEAEHLDVVAGRRTKRKDPLRMRIITKCARFLRWQLIRDGVHDSGCTLRVYRASAVVNLHLRGEMHRYIIAILKIQWFRIGELQVHHRAREHGVTKYNWKKSIKWFIDLLYVWFIAKYQSRPLHLFGFVWLWSACLGVLSFLFSLYQKLWFGMSINRSGYFLVGVFLIQTGIMIFVFGIVIDILLRTYYQSSQEPRYIIKEKL